jgi:hypothetical protein
MYDTLYLFMPRTPPSIKMLSWLGDAMLYRKLPTLLPSVADTREEDVGG